MACMLPEEKKDSNKQTNAALATSTAAKSLKEDDGEEEVVVVVGENQLSDHDDDGKDDERDEKEITIAADGNKLGDQDNVGSKKQQTMSGCASKGQGDSKSTEDGMKKTIVNERDSDEPKPGQANQTGTAAQDGTKSESDGGPSADQLTVTNEASSSPAPPTSPTPSNVEAGCNRTAIEGEPPRNVLNVTGIWLGNLSSRVRDSQLNDMFSQFGTIQQVVKPPEDKWALVYFDNPESPRHAINEYNNKIIKSITNDDTKPLVIRYAANPQEIEQILNSREDWRKVYGDECIHWRRNGCRSGAGCSFAHYPQANGVDKFPWLKPMAIARRQWEQQIAAAMNDSASSMSPTRAGPGRHSYTSPRQTDYKSKGTPEKSHHPF